ncbi:MAG: hypothetical protein LUG14_10125 [Synergistaceae bacterium]|nr:hypothetical protein [Synergistaceae bacterium]
MEGNIFKGNTSDLTVGRYNGKVMDEGTNITSLDITGNVFTSKIKNFQNVRDVDISGSYFNGGAPSGLIEKEGNSVPAQVACASYYTKYTLNGEIPVLSDMVISLPSVKNGQIFAPQTNGGNDVVLTGRIGGGVDAFSTDSFRIYGASGDVNGDSRLTLSMSTDAQIFSNGTIQFYAGSGGGTVSGDSMMVFDAADGSTIYIGGEGSAQRTMILSGGSDAGKISGSARIILNGRLGYGDISPDKYGDKTGYVKVTAACKTNNDGETVIVEGDGIVECNLDFSGGNYGNLTGLYAGPMLHGKNTVGRVNGKTEIIFDHDYAHADKVWVAGFIYDEGGKLYVGSYSLKFKNGILPRSIHGGAANYNKNDTVISGDVSLSFDAANKIPVAEALTRVHGGGFATSGGRHTVNGSVFIEVRGKSGINNLFGGGEAKSGIVSNIHSMGYVDNNRG